MRDRRASLQRRRGIHLHVPARSVAASGEERRRRDDGAAGPVQVGVVLGRGCALRIRHARPAETQAVVLEKLHEDVVAVVEPGAGRECHEGLEAEAVPQLVQDHRDEIDLRAAGIAVEPVVPGERKAAGRSDGAVELSDDVVVRRREIGSGDLVRERLRIVRVRVRRIREVGVDRRGAGRPEGRARRRAAEPVHGGGHPDRHGARELRPPDARGMRERVQALRAERRAGVPADRADHRRILEAFAGAVVVDDGDGRRAAAARQGQQEREEERGAHQCG